MAGTYSNAYSYRNPTIIDTTWQAVRQRPHSLHLIQGMWQPTLHQPNVYHSSHCDIVQRGWDKWSANHPDWYARRSDAREPDWYTRRVNIVRGGDTTYLDWKWDQTSHPTYRRTFGMEDEPKRTGYIGYPDKSHQIEGQIPVPKWGLNHPPHYQDPNRVDAMTPVVL